MKNYFELFTKGPSVNCNRLDKTEHCFDTDDRSKCSSLYMNTSNDNSFVCGWNSGSSNGVVRPRCEPNFSEPCIGSAVADKYDINEGRNSRNNNINTSGSNNGNNEKSGFNWTLLIIILGIIGVGAFVVMSGPNGNSTVAKPPALVAKPLGANKAGRKLKNRVR